MRQSLFVSPPAVLITAFVMHAQNVTPGLMDPLDFTRSGIHLYSATVSSSYYSGAYVLNGLGSVLPAGVGTASEVAVIAGSATLGWQKNGRRGGVSVVYSPLFVRSVYSTQYRSINQSLSLSANRTLGPKWSISGSIRGMLMDFNQLFFAQTRYASLAGTPATFDDFSAAILTGRSDNPALTQLVTAAPLVSSPETAFVYGARELTASAQVSVSYAASTRSTYTFTGTANRAQFMSAGSDAPSANARFLMPQTTGAGGAVSWSYSLTPRTTVSFAGSTNRIISSVQDTYINEGTFSLGRTLSRRWFVLGMVGAGYISPVRQTVAVQTWQQIYGGSIGYKVYAHTFVGSYTRAAADSYGLGANATEASSAAWTWNRPGRSLSLSGSFGYSRLIGPVFPNASSWTASAAASKALSNNLSVTLGYAYVHFPTNVFAAAPNLSQSGITMAVTWLPAGRARRRESPPAGALNN